METSNNTTNSYNTSNNTTNSLSSNASTSVHDGHGAEAYVILSLSTGFAVGALLRHAFKRTPLPYTVVLLVFGMIMGGIARVYEPLSHYTAIAHTDPHHILFIFLPTLVFESAFAMDVHTFRKTIIQTIILAGPGLALCTFLTALLGKYIFTYDWGWMPSLMFGCILSATDPVAVVALLKDVGASKQLGTVIEGESLLNDGAAIVLFEVFKAGSIPGGAWDASQISIYFIRVAFGGPAFGFLMGKLSVIWLSYVFNDALVEITITLASTYFTFYVGETFLKVSGVLAVLTLGIEINSQKANISPEVEVFLHRFWEMMGYLANTLIFIIVGVVITEQAFSNVTGKDVLYLVSVYIGIMVIRSIVLFGLSPIMDRFGYGMSVQNNCVMIWGGLRGAVGLTLALIVAQHSGIDEENIGSKVLFHTAGIVVFTLILNATTVKPLLRLLGMSEVSTARQLTVTAAVRRVRQTAANAISILKEDRFLCDSNWESVKAAVHVDDIYETEDVEFMKDQLASTSQSSQCPSCKTPVPAVLKPKELAEVAEEARQRYIKAEKTSYWKQFEHGMLGREAVRILQAAADSAMDEPNKLVGLKDIEHTWIVPRIYIRLRELVVRIHKSLAKPPDEIPEPSHGIQRLVYHLVSHPVFDWCIIGLIMANMILIIMELAASEDASYKGGLRIANYVFCSIYIVECVLKAIGFRRHYILPLKKNLWNWFDIVIVVISVGDICIDTFVPENENGGGSNFSPALLRVARILRVARVGRGLRTFKLIFPFVMKVIDNIINRYLSLGYDIGKGFVMAVEEISKHIDRMVEHEDTARRLKLQSDINRLEVIRSLALLRKEHPGVAISVKTRHAIRSVLNRCHDVLQEMQSDGLIDEGDGQKLSMIIEVKMKRLQNAPAHMIPSAPETLLRSITWLGDTPDDLTDRIIESAVLREYQADEVIIHEGEVSDGIYLVVSGLVRISAKREIDQSDIYAHVLKTTDYLSSGTVLGEMGVLTGMSRSASIFCETAVQAFFIDASYILSFMCEHPPLADRLWRVCGMRIANTMLANNIFYTGWGSQQLRLLCETGYIEVLFRIPDGDALEIDESMREVIIVYNKVVCLPSGEIVGCPAIIPHGTTKVKLPEQTEDTTCSRDHARLLVIPRPEVQSSGGHRGSKPHVRSEQSSGQLKKAKRTSILDGKRTQHLAILHFLRRSTKVHPEGSAESGEWSTQESGFDEDAVDH